MTIKSLGVLACAAVLCIGSPTKAESATEFDLLIRGGTVIDGTGAAPRVADVGVQQGKIVLVGDASKARARVTVNAQGLAVAPGFIDAHVHGPEFFFDVRDIKSGETRSILNEGFITQGVTTVVVGPDGAFGPDMLRAINKLYGERGVSTNYAFYVGHNGIRRTTIGMSPRTATADELDKMRRLVREGMELGAVGLSTGLMYLPGIFAPTSEVVELAREVRPYGGIYDSHVRDPAFRLLESDAEAIQIGREAGIPVKIAHEKAPGPINHGRMTDIISMIDAARATGLSVVTDTYPYDGAQTEFVEDVLIVPGLPRGGRAELAPKARAERRRQVRERLADPATRATIVSATEKGLEGGFAWVKAVGYGGFRVVDSPKCPHLVGRNVEKYAQEKAVSPFEVLEELLADRCDGTLLTMADLDGDDLRQLLRQPWTMIASDGGYVGRDGAMGIRHPRSTGTFTRVLRQYVREEQLLTLPEAIRRMSSLPADFLQLRDRGRISPGLVADIVVFDPKTVTDRSTWTDPYAFSTGIEAVIVNGVPVLRAGEITGAAPGRFVPRQTSALQ